MNTFEKDTNLKNVLKSIKLDSPEPNFTVRVMDKIFKENLILEKIKNERIFGKGFWIILALFVILFVSMFILRGSETTLEGSLLESLPSVNSKGVQENYQNFFQKIGTVPLSIAGILLASSLLLFIERFISSKLKIR